MLEYRTPESGSHAGHNGNSSDGATTNQRRAPAQRPELFHDTPFSAQQMYASNLTADSQRTLTKLLKSATTKIGTKATKRTISSPNSKNKDNRHKPKARTAKTRSKTPRPHRKHTKYHLRKRWPQAQSGRTKKGRSVPCGTVVSAEELQDDPITRGLQLEIKSKFCF